MSDWLSAHLSVAEFIGTSHRELLAEQEAAWVGNPVLHRNAERLARDVFEPIRGVLFVPLRVSSGFRCKELNDAVGGKTSSLHLEALAIDIIPIGIDVRIAFYAILHAMKAGQLTAIDRLAIECGRWLHVQAPREGVAAQLLAFESEDGRSFRAVRGTTT